MKVPTHLTIIEINAHRRIVKRGYLKNSTLHFQKKSFILNINSLSKIMSLKEFCLFLVLVSTTRANIQEIIKDCTMVPDATPTVDKEYQWLKREDFSQWNIKIYNQTHTYLDYKRYTNVQDLANGYLFFKIFDFNEKDVPKSMIEQQIREIIQTLIFIYSSGPGTPDWANTHDIYDHCYDSENCIDQSTYTGRSPKPSVPTYYPIRGISYKKVPKSVRACASYCGNPADICIH